jgi:hypothetical protein
MSTTDPAEGVLRSLERADTALSLVESRLNKSLHATCATVNPTRLLKRLATLEQELPRLRAAAERNAAARHEILGALFAQQENNQLDIRQLARRADANIDQAMHDWGAARGEAKAHLSQCTGSSIFAGAETDGKPWAGASQHLLVPPASADAAPSEASSAVTELQWLRLTQEMRAGLSLAELDSFWRALRGHFVRRETRELQAAQLLALGIRIGEEKNAQRMRILEHLGLLRMRHNSVCLAA